MQTDLQIKHEKSKQIADALSALLADTYMLYLKTQNFHWNIKGKHFRSLHLLFEEQYTEMAAAIDVIAERIQILGYTAPGTFSKFSQLTSIKENDLIPSEMDMVKELLRDNENLAKSWRGLSKKAQEAEDEGTIDLMAQRIRAHEKAAWMLRSTLEG